MYRRWDVLANLEFVVKAIMTLNDRQCFNCVFNNLSYSQNFWDYAMEVIQLLITT